MVFDNNTVSACFCFVLFCFVFLIWKIILGGSIIAKYYVEIMLLFVLMEAKKFFVMQNEIFVYK